MTNLEITEPGDIIVDPNETNIVHAFQGDFRRSFLDLDLLDYAVSKDPMLKDGNRDVLVLTCVDHLKEYTYTHNERKVTFDTAEEMATSLAAELNFGDVFISDAPSGDFKSTVEGA
jgi:hypothetical protein